ncbi:MAG: hypothetical protein ACKVQA_17920 [Burkholderiales bacterium]
MKSILAVMLLLMVSACATYVTPGAGVRLKVPSTPEEDAGALTAVEPTAAFPARIAIARIQDAGYIAKGTMCTGSGKYCLVVTRDAQTQSEAQRIARFPMVAGLAPIVSPASPSLQSYADVRAIAESLDAGILLLYSLDTAFRVDTKPFGPMDVISLGMTPKKNTRVTTNATSLLLDVKTGFVYGVAEATATEESTASAWTSAEKADAVRLRTETAAFQRLITEVERLWAGIAKEHGGAGK